MSFSTATAAPTSHTVTGRNGRRFAALLVALTLGGAACNSSPEDIEAVAGETSSTTETTETTETTAAPSVEPASAGSGSSSQPTPSAAPAAGSSSGSSAAAAVTCSAAQVPAIYATVVNIPAGDPDGGLVLRAAADPGSARLSVLPEGFVYETIYAAESDCVVRPDGSVWWMLWDEANGVSGFANSAYLFGTDAFDEQHPEGHPEEEADFGPHVDCLNAPSMPNCVTVERDAAGNLVALVFPAELELDWAHLDCAYNGSAEACAALAMVGYEPGNFLTQAPTEALREDCATLEAAAQALACAELATRG